MPDPIIIYSLELGAAVLFWLVYVVVESAAFQFVNWGDFRQCLRASLLANLASVPVIAASLIWIPRFGLFGLICGGLIAIFIEGAVLRRLKRGANRINWIAAIVANLASFFLLTLPVYIYVRAYFR
jgi:hypothetical protein